MGGGGVVALGGGVELGAALDDVSGGSRRLGVSAECESGLEMQVPLESEAETDADRGELGQARVA